MEDTLVPILPRLLAILPETDQMGAGVELRAGPERQRNQRGFGCSRRNDKIRDSPGEGKDRQHFNIGVAA